MTITKEAYLEIETKFVKITKLIEEDSKADPANDPYRSKYTAKQLLITVKAQIECLRRVQPEDSPEHIKLTAMLSLSYLYLARIASDTEEVSTAGKHILKCLKIIDKYESHPECIIISVNALNLKAVLKSNADPEMSKSCLDKSILLFKQFKQSGRTPINLNNLVKQNASDENSDLAAICFEKAHTLTLYYLAQIYGTLNDAVKSSIYCHITLNRQLQYNDYEPIDWCLNAATLSQFFTEHDCFKQARHHLAASSYMLQKYEDQLNEETERNEELNAKIENLKHRSADVARCWAKYGLALLMMSKDRLLKQADDSDLQLSTNLKNLDLTENNISKEEISNLEFDIDLDIYEQQVTDQFVLTIEDARPVFLNIKAWLLKAQEYYTLQTLASDYIEIAQDQSNMYANLLFFDDDPGNQAKLHKRRVDLLENVLKEINPKYYLKYCRELWFEIGTIYRDIFYIKMDKLQELKGHPTPQTLTKINSLLNKSVLHYNSFINSFKDNLTKELPEIIDGNYEKLFLTAFFNIGALSGRFISLDKRVLLEYTQASLNGYKYVFDYCERNPKIVEEIPDELGICREMVTLLPIKITKLASEIPS